MFLRILYNEEIKMTYNKLLNVIKHFFKIFSQIILLFPADISIT